MKTEVFVNPNFSYLTNFIKQIPESFNEIGNELHNGRNEVRLVDVNGLKIIVKYFKRITWANRLIFATIRKTKAQRAFEHSILLLKSGFSSPVPVAYVDVYKKGLLFKSFYISLYTDYKPIKQLFSLPIAESEEALKAFSRYTYRLHRAGIFHDDYNLSNVLYSYNGHEYDFSLIDNNRMRFRRYSYGRGIRNLERLKIPVDRMGIIAAEYARESHASDIHILNAMIFYRLQYLFRVSFKKKFKALVRLLPGKHHEPPIVMQKKEISVKVIS